MSAAPYSITTKAKPGRKSHLALLRGAYGTPVVEVSGPTAALAKARLLQTVADCVNHVGAITTIFCNDGTVLTLYRGVFGGWECTITDPTREYASGVLMRETNRQAAEKNATDHAAQSYGGVLKVLR